MIDRAFLILIGLAVAMGPAYALVLKSAGPVAYALVMSGVVAVLAVYHLNRPDSRLGKVGLALALTLCLPSHYGATGTVNRILARPTLDEALIGWDTFFMGWLVPKGQFPLWLDTNAWVGPASPAGLIITEFLQLMYFSYYFWGHLLLIYLMFRAWRHFSRPAEWENLKSFCCAWIGAYFVNFVFYVLVPVIGPKFHHPELFANPVNGLGLASAIQDFIASNQATAEDCFPSGHTALSWITGVCALRFTPKYGRWALAAAIPITAATIYLRYHYITDLIAAVPLILLGLAWGGFLRRPERAAEPMAAGPATA